MSLSIELYRLARDKMSSSRMWIMRTSKWIVVDKIKPLIACSLISFESKLLMAAISATDLVVITSQQVGNALKGIASNSGSLGLQSLTIDSIE